MITETSVRVQLLQGDMEQHYPFLRNEWFLRAVANVPDCDVDEILNVTSERGAMSRQDVAWALARNRWANRICDRCWNKERPQELKMCVRCCLTFYCNRRCQEKDWPRHKLRCCAENAVLEDGPQRVEFCRISNPEEAESCGQGSTATLLFDS